MARRNSFPDEQAVPIATVCLKSAPLFGPIFLQLFPEKPSPVNVTGLKKLFNFTQ